MAISIRMQRLLWVFMFLAGVLCWSIPARADGKTITSGKCQDLKKQDIPVGDFAQPPHMPQSNLTITQTYNTSHEEGYWWDGKWWWGHDGLDTSGEAAGAGVNDVYAISKGVVVLSMRHDWTSGWGESIIIATRPNLFSEEIVTHHYHHLHAAPSSEPYQTTRRFNACEEVKAGDVLGKEGRTGHATGPHLHLTIRRWKNITQLNDAIVQEGKALFGHGYAMGNNARIAGHLDPEGIVYGTFRDYESGAPHQWSLSYVNKMRSYGIEFGLFDGRYGAGELVSRREAARWIKIAAEQLSVKKQQPTFGDVPPDDSDHVYVEPLTLYPDTRPVINPDHTCNPNGSYFCPDSTINRAEVLKMVVLAFYGREYLELYKYDIWENSFNAAYALLSQFVDVLPSTWYASYVYFGVVNGLVAPADAFNPQAAIAREELAKWIVLGYEHLQGAQNGPCTGVTCPLNHYCEWVSGFCYSIPVCVPSETKECEIGGGYQPPPDSDPPQPAECVPGTVQQQSCDNGNGYMMRGCDQNGLWSPWTSCIPNAEPDPEPQPECAPGQTSACGMCGTQVCDQNGIFGSCMNQGVCIPGATQTQTCNGNGEQTRTCSQSCAWGVWGQCDSNDPPPPQCECASGVCCDGCYYKPQSAACDLSTQYQCEGSDPGDDGQYGQVETFCSGYDAGCNGQTVYYGWLTYQDCSLSQVCQMSGGTPQCVGSCQDTYAAPQSQSCFSNPQGAGNPTLCLELNQQNGAQWEYRICKQSGTFQNSFTYFLKDDNHLINFSTYSGSAGSSCSPWKNVNVNYIPGYGAMNGAGLIGHVTSPSGCVESACQYKTGGITVSKSCQ